MKEENHRRRLFKGALAVAVTTVAGCRWDSDTSLPLGGAPSAEATPAPAPASNPPSSPEPSGAGTWSPYVPALIVGTSASFDLNTTLPSGIKRGGMFGIDPSGPRLPAGMSLTAAGILAVGSAAIGTVAGVIFTYDVP